MPVSYKKLWKLLIDKEMLKKDLSEKTGINSSTIARMSNNEFVSLEVLVRICNTLDCDIGDIVEVTHEVAPKEENSEVAGGDQE